jgi:hypothetical protein
MRDWVGVVALIYTVAFGVLAIKAFIADPLRGLEVLCAIFLVIVVFNMGARTQHG